MSSKGGDHSWSSSGWHGDKGKGKGKGKQQWSAPQQSQPYQYYGSNSSLHSELASKTAALTDAHSQLEQYHAAERQQACVNETTQCVLGAVQSLTGLPLTQSAHVSMGSEAPQLNSTYGQSGQLTPSHTLQPAGLTRSLTGLFGRIAGIVDI